MSEGLKAFGTGRGLPVTRTLPLLALLACAPEPRPEIPRVLPEVEALAPRVDLLAARVMVDSELHAQATAYVLARAQRRAARVRRTVR